MLYLGLSWFGDELLLSRAAFPTCGCRLSVVPDLYVYVECVSFYVILKFEKFAQVQYFEFHTKHTRARALHETRKRQHDDGKKCEIRAKYEYVCTDFDCVTELCSQVFGVNMRFRISTSVSTHRIQNKQIEREIEAKEEMKQLPRECWWCKSIDEKCVARKEDESGGQGVDC